MSAYEVAVTLSGTVDLTVEADSEEEARELACEQAEIGDVNSWDATAEVVLKPPTK